jgi:hypothetical protein
MSPCAVCVSQAPALFPELSGKSWSPCEGIEESFDEDNPFVPTNAGSQLLGKEPLNDAELVGLAQNFLERSETLIDVVAPPPWEDEDDIFNGEVFDGDRAEYQQLSSANPTAEQKETIARQLMANEATRYPGCTAGFLIALALTYRKILLDPLADPRDKVEILRRVYSTHEPEWMTAEIVYLHFILLDQCRYLSRTSASMERKEETLRWIYTDPELEDRPFSFKSCVKLVSGNTPDFGAIHRRLKEEMRPVLTAWLRESLARKRTADDRQPELFDM